MIRFLKGAVAVLLLAAVAGTWLGIRVYDQQQALIAQLQTHQAGDLQLAHTLDLDLPDWKQRIVSPSEAAPALQQLDIHAKIVMEDLARTADDLAAEKTLVAQLAKEKALIETELAASQGDRDDLTDRLARVEAEKQAVEMALNTSRGELATAHKEIDELEGQLKDTEGELADSRAEIKALNVILDDRASGPFHIAKGAAQEAVIVASRPDFGFVVLDKGSADLLQNGVTALVHRDETLVGKVRLTHTQSNMSMASVDPEWRIGEIKVGDRVLIERVVSR